MQPSDSFFAGQRYAVFGVRARGRSHGPILVAALRKAGKRAVAIEPDGVHVEKAETYRTLAEAGPVDGVVLLPPSPWSAATEAFLREAFLECKAAQVRAIWIYPAGDPAPCAAFAASEGLDPVAGVCPCLYIEGGGFPHNLHRWLLKVIHKL